MAKEPTFADLCEAVRRTRHAHAHAILAANTARDQLKLLDKAQADAEEDEKNARYDLEEFIDRETEVAE